MCEKLIVHIYKINYFVLKILKTLETIFLKNLLLITKKILLFDSTMNNELVYRERLFDDLDQVRKPFLFLDFLEFHTSLFS